MKIILALVIFCSSLQVVKACSCAPAMTFCEGIASFDGEIFADLIVRAKVSDSDDMTKHLEIREVLYGAIDVLDIQLHYDMCTLGFNDLKGNSDYILALSDYDDKYHLVGCAVSFLKIEGEKVVGAVAPGIVSIDYHDLFDAINCSDIADQIGAKGDINIASNLVSGQIQIQNKSERRTYNNVNVALFNTGGSLTHSIQHIAEFSPGEQLTLTVDGLSSGLYILVVFDEFSKKSHRIFKL